MSDRRPTFLSTLFEASVMDRWSERYLSTRLLYIALLLPFAWEWPEEFTRDNWGKLDFRVWAILTVWGTGIWQMYRAWRKLWEMKEAYHFMEEERMKKVVPQQITINDNDGPARPGVEWGVNRGDHESRELDEFEADHLRRENASFDPKGINKIYEFFSKKP